MQFMFNEDSNLYGYENGDKEFEFPTNIKQMGCLDDEIKIYMEDYVYTYLYQYAKSNANQEKLAALVGKHMVVKNQQMIVISGAIQGKDTIKENGAETFTKDSWNYINNQMDIYFKGLSIVGWMHTQPGFGAFLMPKDEVFHKEFFKNPWQTLYVLDPQEKLDAFFIHSNNNAGMRAARGYFIYYSKNENMQDYMLNNSVVKPKLSEEEQRYYDRDCGIIAQEQEMIEKNERIDAAQKIRQVLNNKADEHTVAMKKYTVLAGVSGALCLCCIVMGASLLHSQNRIARLENEVVTVKTSYNTIAAEMSHTQAVFAAQNKEAEQTTKKQEPEAVKKQEEAAPSQPQVEPKSVPEPVVKPVDTAPQASMDRPIYVVKDGDTLGAISNQFYGSSAKVEEILKLNNMDNPNKLKIGQTLLMPY